MTEDDVAPLRDKIINRLRTVHDPEIPVNIYDLGLIYRLNIERTEDQTRFDLEMDMTLTAPGCPVADQIVAMARNVLLSIDELDHVDVNLVWNPPWDKSRMSDEARLQLDLF